MAHENPHAALSVSLCRWLRRAAETLARMSLAFEAGEAESLANDLEMFHQAACTPEGFLRIWQEIEVWGETDVSTDSGREKTLCNIPPLPEPLEC